MISEQEIRSHQKQREDTKELRYWNTFGIAPTGGTKLASITLPGSRNQFLEQKYARINEIRNKTQGQLPAPELSQQLFT